MIIDWVVNNWDLGAGAILISMVVVRLSILFASVWRQKIRRKNQRQSESKLLACHIALAQTVHGWEGYRKFILDRRTMETDTICSFHLVPHDKKKLPSFKPGQYLTFKLNIPDRPKPLIRCYSLSASPNHTDHYRVSIKKAVAPLDKPDIPSGLGSTFFHDHLKIGDILEIKAPSGKFFLDVTKEQAMGKERPVVLIAGGVGLTPLLSMLNTLIENRSSREIWIFYGITNGTEHMQKNYLSQLNHDYENLHLHVCYSKPSGNDMLGRDFHHVGRIDFELLQNLLPSSNYEFYVCGPPNMLETLTKDLKGWGVPTNRIFFERFGAATVKKMAPSPTNALTQTEISVTFSHSAKNCIWTSNDGTLLDFAEANGIILDFGCRAGNCGTCEVPILSGEVTYLTEIMPSGKIPDLRSCLTCIAMPMTNLTLDA